MMMPSVQARSTCGEIKQVYQAHACCGQSATKKVDAAVYATDTTQSHASPYAMLGTTNPCAGKKPTNTSFDNKPCFLGAVLNALEQAGANVTQGFQGTLDATPRVPITTQYYKAGLCPVNVHWHLGAEHYSVGQYDENGEGPPNTTDYVDPAGRLDLRRLAANSARLGFQCHHYKTHKTDPRFTTEYNWKHCVGMHVGETYEVHWPHSAAGHCGSPWQFQTPFYDGVFCVDGVITSTHEHIGVQAQVFTIVNDERYFYPNLMRGMIYLPGSNYGTDMAHYTGSTTGTSRDNSVCSSYAAITWQVDRKCHLISASSFDKMCADMKLNPDDMSDDLYAHGSRRLVWQNLSANNQQRL